ncbi:putative quinol monooxygenase [Microbacteriaceae bacterium 4G12]
MTDAALTTTAATSVRLIPILEAKRGFEQKLALLLADLEAASRRDSGCVDYTIFRQDGSSSVFVLHEEWTSAEALQAHNEQPHVTEFLAAAEPLMTRGLTVYRPAPPVPAGTVRP